MSNHLRSRKFLSSMIMVPALASSTIMFNPVSASQERSPPLYNGLKTSLNAFSFNAPLSDGSMTISDMLDFSEEPDWQIKEKIFVNGAEVDTDIDKLLGIIKASRYRGYLPIKNAWRR